MQIGLKLTSKTMRPASRDSHHTSWRKINQRYSVNQVRKISSPGTPQDVPCVSQDFSREARIPTTVDESKAAGSVVSQLLAFIDDPVHGLPLWSVQLGTTPRYLLEYSTIMQSCIARTRKRRSWTQSPLPLPASFWK